MEANHMQLLSLKRIHATEWIIILTCFLETYSIPVTNTILLHAFTLKISTTRLILYLINKLMEVSVLDATHIRTFRSYETPLMTNLRYTWSRMVRTELTRVIITLTKQLNVTKGCQFMMK